MELLVFAIGFEIILNFGKLCLSLRHDKISSLNMMNYIFFRVDIHILWYSYIVIFGAVLNKRLLQQAGTWNLGEGQAVVNYYDVVCWSHGVLMRHRASLPSVVFLLILFICLDQNSFTYYIVIECPQCRKSQKW